jgi:hydrogenase expression/formation protein HypC
MCLGVPGRVLSVREGALRTGRVAFGPITKDVCLEYVPEAGVGDYVVVHVGFAITKISESDAERVFGYLESIGEIE